MLVEAVVSLIIAFLCGVAAGVMGNQWGAVDELAVRVDERERMRAANEAYAMRILNTRSMRHEDDQAVR